LDLATDFDEFCALLLDSRVEFVVVGAHALALHGAPRFTGDLDVLVRPTLDNTERLIGAIRDFGVPDIPMTASQLLSPRTVLEMGVVPVQIHVMTAIDGVEWDEIWQGRVEAAFGSRQVPFIGRAQFLKNKRAAGRPKDLADIAALSDQSE
jgi:hypothetical protein